jgi:hypothetical protein
MEEKTTLMDNPILVIALKSSKRLLRVWDEARGCGMVNNDF